MAQTPCPGHSYSECRAYNSNNMCHHFQHGLAYRRGSVDGPVSFINWSIIRARALGEGEHASVFSWAWHAVFQVSILAKSVWPKGQTTVLRGHIPLMFYPRCVRCENRLCERHWSDDLELDRALGRRAKIQKSSWVSAFCSSSTWGASSEVVTGACGQFWTAKYMLRFLISFNDIVLTFDLYWYECMWNPILCASLQRVRGIRFFHWFCNYVTYFIWGV